MSTRSGEQHAGNTTAKNTTTGSKSGTPDYLASLRLVGRFISGSWVKLYGSVFLATLATAAELVPIWAVYRVVDSAISGTLDMRFALLHAGIALAGVVIGYAFLAIAMSLSHIVAFDAIYRLRLAVARHMALLPLGYFTSKKSGDAKKLVVDEPEKLELIVAHGLPEGVSGLATWLAVSIWLFAVDWRMALAAIFMTPVSFVLMTLAMAGSGHKAAIYQAANARMNGSIVEYLAGMPVVKMFNRTGESLAETSAAVRNYAEIEAAWARDYIPLGGSFYTLVLTNIVIILPVGLALMAGGTLDLPTLLLFVLLGAHYSQPLLKLFNQFHTLAHISMGSMLVADLLAEAPQENTGRKRVLINHDIVFENVSFAYDSTDVLHDVGFTAKTNEITALVGHSGSGKSTIASLVPRFWDVRSGRITLGGVDIRDIGLDQLMETIAFVFQDTFLFSDTIAANIRFGNPDASDAEVEAAARSARAHDFIASLPDGYQTHLGEHGGTLSGGERQRLAIARAILKNAPVVVLDEATAFADPDNEAAIQEAIGELTKGRTLIVVAHRLHTIAHANTIVVVEKGRVAEQGRHEDLVAGQGPYARLWLDYTATRSIRLHEDAQGQHKEAAQ